MKTNKLDSARPRFFLFRSLSLLAAYCRPMQRLRNDMPPASIATTAHCGESRRKHGCRAWLAAVLCCALLPGMGHAGTTTRVSVDSAGNQANTSSGFLSLSANGRYVAFHSRANNLVASDTNGNGTDIFVHDRQTGATTRVNVDSAGNQANNDSYSFAPALSADGRYVAFYSDASNLVAGDTNGVGDIFVHGGQAFASTCDIANPIVPCDLGGTTYDAFAGNYSGNRSFYKASSYDISISGGYLCLNIKIGLPHSDGYAFVANYGTTVWTSPAPYSVNFGIFGQFNGSCIEQANNFEWIGFGSQNPPPVLPTPEKLTLPVLSPEPPTTQQRGLVLAVHGWNANSEDWPEKMVASIKSSIQAVGNDNIKWTVLPWDWGVEAGDSVLSPIGSKAPWVAWSNAFAVGESLAKQIGGTYDYVHLIAHSAGSNVIQEVAFHIRNRKNIKQPKIHLTFLDAYHPAQDYSVYGLFADWAEQYVDRSIVPIPGTLGLPVLGTDATLHDAFNFDVTGWSSRPSCGILNFVCPHRWPYEWYQDSISFSSSTTPYLFGYSRSIEAGSTLPNHNPNGLFKRGALCTLEDTSSNCLPTHSLALTTLKFLPQEVVTTTSSLVKNIYKSSTGVVSDAVSGVISLFSGSPVWVTLELDLPQAISGLQFDYQFGGTGEGLLTVYLDDQRVYAADQRNGTGVKKSAGPFTVGSVSAGKHFLSFRLDNFDGPPSLIDLSAITVGSFALEPVLNEPPIAVAGDYRTVRVKSNVALNGSGSHDPEDAALSFQWWQVSGAAVTLTSPIAERPVFTPSAPGKYVFNLSVNDGLVDSFPASVVISVPALGDIDADGDVDSNDLNVVLGARNQPASGPNDLRDLDGNMKLDALDARKLTALCTRPRCATQ